MVIGAILGCSGKTSTDLCALGNLGGGDSGLSGGNGAMGGSIACPVTTGGSDFDCPNLESRYSNCTATHMGSAFHRVNMLLVIDASSSMSEPHPSGSGLSKWDTMRSALGTMLSHIDGFRLDSNPAYGLGLELFPNSPASSANDAGTSDGCQIPTGSSAINVPIHTGTAQLNKVFDVISSHKPSGYTPTAQALRRALEYYTQGDGRCLAGSKYVTLVTNGGANCNSALSCGAGSCTDAARTNCSDPSNCCNDAGYLCDDQEAVLAVIDELKNSYVYTYVVGMPNTDSERASLDAFANAGGVPNINSASGEAYYPIPDAFDIPDLGAQFISGYVTTCDIPLQQTPARAEDTHVFFDCMPVYQTPADGGSGWYIDFSYTPAHLVFRGDACTALVSNVPNKALDIFTDCPSN